MKRSILIKFVVLMPIVILTYITSSSIVAQYLPAKPTAATGPAKPTAATGPAKTTFTTAVVDEDAATPHVMTDAERRALQRATVASTSLRHFTVEPLPGAVRVAAEVAILDKRPGHLYLWRLRAYRGEALVADQDFVYADEAFSVDPSGEEIVPFEATMKLPPGEHRVVLNLHHFNEPADVPRLYDKAFEATATSARVWKMVKID